MTELAALAESVRSALCRADLTPERRKFMPHITIARFRKPPTRAKLNGYLAAFSSFRTPAADINSFHLFSSDLQPTGAHYRIEKTFSLTGAQCENFGMAERNHS